jgi:hypothetical protein
MKKFALFSIKWFITYFLAFIILLQLLPFAFIVAIRIKDGNELGRLPPYLYYDTISELLNSYIFLLFLSLKITALHLLIRYLVFHKPNPFFTYVLPFIKRTNRTWYGSILLRWLIPLPLAFFFTRYLFMGFEQHLEYGKVGCWDTGFPFTYYAGCSTPPIPGMVHRKIIDYTTSAAYIMDRNIYLATAVVSIIYINFLSFSGIRFVRLSSRYFAALFLLLTVAPPWFRGYNNGLLEVGTPLKFISHYYDRGNGDVYEFIGKGLWADLLVCLGAALIFSMGHFFWHNLNKPSLDKA